MENNPTRNNKKRKNRSWSDDLNLLTTFQKVKMNADQTIPFIPVAKSTIYLTKPFNPMQDLDFLKSEGQDFVLQSCKSLILPSDLNTFEKDYSSLIKSADFIMGHPIYSPVFLRKAKLWKNSTRSVQIFIKTL